MDEKCTWGIPDCRNSKVVEKCPKTCDACNGKCYATFVENTNSLKSDPTLYALQLFLMEYFKT